MKRITINHPCCSYEVWDRVMSFNIISSKARHEFSESTLTFSYDLYHAPNFRDKRRLQRQQNILALLIRNIYICSHKTT